MKITVALALLGHASALENAETDGKTEVATWADADVKYKGPYDRSCSSSRECMDNQVCAGHRWEYNNQRESARGCWDKSVCNNNGAYWMFDGRMIQFYCDGDAGEKFGYPKDGDWGSLAYPIWPNEGGKRHWENWEETCQTHQDCKNKSGRGDQHCTDFIWEADEAGDAYGQGTACYTWDINYCYNDEKGPDYEYKEYNPNDWKNTKGAGPADAADWAKDKEREGDRDRRGGDGGEFRMGDFSMRASENEVEINGPDGMRMRANEKDGIEIEGPEGIRVRAHEKDGLTIEADMMRVQMREDRLEIVLGATKIAASALSALVAASLY